MKSIEGPIDFVTYFTYNDDVGRVLAGEPMHSGARRM
jgi:hypothetical protein